MTRHGLVSSKGRRKKNPQYRKKNAVSLKGRRAIAGLLLVSAVVLGLLYGPYGGFRDFWITTAMHTSDHRYLATLLYPASTIDQVMKANAVLAFDETSLPLNSSSKAAREPCDAIERFSVKTASSSGFILKIHDPSRVSLAVADSPKGFLIEDFNASKKVAAAMNASAYRTNQSKGLPLGIVIADGKLIEKGMEPRHSIIGLNRKDELVLGIFFDWELERLELRDAVEYGPYLIINGKRAVITGNGGGLAPRSAIAQTQDGAILFLVIDGRNLESFGASMKEVQDILLEYGAVNAACLDGGASVSLYFNGFIVNDVNAKEENRRLPNAFIVS